MNTIQQNQRIYQEFNIIDFLIKIAIANNKSLRITKGTFIFKIPYYPEYEILNNIDKTIIEYYKNGNCIGKTFLYNMEIDNNIVKIDFIRDFYYLDLEETESYFNINNLVKLKII